MMETLNEKVTRLESLSAMIAVKNTDAVALLNQVYTEIFNENIQQGCGNCYQKAFYRIQKFTLLQSQNIHSKTSAVQNDKKFILKPGTALQITFGGDYLTNNNLTDVIAAKMMLANPDISKYFDRYPFLADGQPDTDALNSIASGKNVKTSTDHVDVQPASVHFQP